MLPRRSVLIANAQLSGSAGRYKEMVDYMEQLMTSDRRLALEEQNLLALAYKNVIDPMRYAFKIINAGLPNTGEIEPSFLEAQQLFARAIQEEIQETVRRAIKNVDGDLTKPHKLSESQVLNLKLKGDYFRYLAEITDAEEKTHVAEYSLIAYKQALSLAIASLPPSDPIRLGVALNFANFYQTIVNDTDRACSLAAAAFDEASSAMSNLSDEARQDSALVMQLLRECIDAWTRNIVKKPENVNTENTERESLPEVTKPEMLKATGTVRSSVGF
ncbi:hypothetical protein EG68_05432 [Paragonimus skrjabini miyazakii]|uniref:14-3-3 domain-containing protein n=1 Tax=Paragonimus skrjabini miyazakii TaxID=59628 RepID=A0A8S9YR11_9TREM|nr:hypothetical protein EG68_05432 [Paragonimus skrjabini miyazakii]